MSSEDTPDKPLIRTKVVLAGQPGVGKTSLTRRFVSNEFSEHHIETIGVRVEKRTIDLDTHRVEMMVWDVAGVEDSAPFHSSYLRGAAGVIFVADQTDLASVQRLKDLDSLVRKAAPDHLQVAILNKSDLPIAEEAHTAFNELPMATKIRTSALTGEGVEGAFKTLAESAVAKTT